MNSWRPDVVFDCNVFLQAFLRATGPADEALSLAEGGQIILYVSKPILRELRRALTYPEIRRENPHITDQLADAYLDRITFRRELLRKVPHISRLPRDPDDQPYLDLAIAVAADYLVTRDKDLLSLATEYSSEAREFRRRLPNARILNPIDFLRELHR